MKAFIKGFFYEGNPSMGRLIVFLCAVSALTATIFYLALSCYVKSQYFNNVFYPPDTSVIDNIKTLVIWLWGTAIAGKAINKFVETKGTNTTTIDGGPNGQS